MYKTHNWNQKKLAQTLQNVYGKLSEHVHLYKLRTDIVFEKGCIKDDVRVLHTLNFFELNHPDSPIQFKNCKYFFQLIKQYDKPIRLENNDLLYHSYILMMHIYQYLHLFSFYMDGTFRKTTLASFRGDKQRYLSKFNEISKRIQEVDAIDSGANLIKQFIYKNLYDNSEIADAFINQCTLFPIHQIKDLDSSAYEVKIIKKSIEFFGSTNFSSKRPIYKSLSIILIAYLTLKMNIPKKQAIDVVQILFDDLFYDFVGERYEIDISATKLLSNVYITGRLDGLPIFASNDDEENYTSTVYDSLEKFYNESENELNIDFRAFDYRTYSPLKNLPSIYLSLLPMEFVQPYL